ncbi:hypothetical protein J7U46_08825 [Pelomonas sp. V22]|uniref:hypothetical protein n=1 Tax=Pelomonas sp. V22 TaxID=2822139 RepID=UPI0024A93EF8|nr:hypothetical protein [Pelomonas sp. V22]MDI4633147.1 hypothetical protein [Pelomonas sp. V22]
MPKHAVTVTTPTLTLGKADTVFEVVQDDQKLGELRISTGAAVWYRNGVSYGKKLSWSKLADLFAEHGTARAETKKRTSRQS